MSDERTCGACTPTRCCEDCALRGQRERDLARRVDEERHGLANEVDGAKPPAGWAWAQSEHPYSRWEVVRLSAFDRIEPNLWRRDTTTLSKMLATGFSAHYIVFAPLPAVLAAVLP